MQTIELTKQIDALENGQTVNVTHDNYVRHETVNGIVHKGYKYFYIQPVGDSHPGASISKGNIVSINETNGN